MRRTWTMPLGVMAMVLGGCNNSQKPVWDPTVAYQMDTYSVGIYREDATRNAIVAQHTIYPFHFVDGGSQLNELGRYDMAVLSSAYKAGSPGVLNVRRMDDSDDLYDARVKSVAEALRSAGVDVSRVTISDGLPGGPGETADRVLSNLAQSRRPLKSTTDGQTGGIQLIDVNSPAPINGGPK